MICSIIECGPLQAIWQEINDNIEAHLKFVNCSFTSVRQLFLLL